METFDGSLQDFLWALHAGSKSGSIDRSVAGMTAAGSREGRIQQTLMGSSCLSAVAAPPGPARAWDL